MKKLKFRIWDKQLKKFLYQLPEQHHLDWKRFEVQQFTGLLDAHGKEIYEGDIVKVKRKFLKKDKIAKWSKDNYVVEFWQYWGRYNLVYRRKDGMEIYKLFGLIGRNKDLEVIGNIYENQELLK